MLAKVVTLTVPFAIFIAVCSAQVRVEGFYYVGSTSYDGLTLKSYYVSATLKVLGVDVRENCKKHSMDSLSIDTAEEFAAFKKLLSRNRYANIRESLHFGAQVTVGTNHTQWHWESSGKPITYPLTFAGAGPDNAGGAESCLEIVYQDAAIGLNDIVCAGSAKKFLCLKVGPVDGNKPVDSKAYILIKKD